MMVLYSRTAGGNFESSYTGHTVRIEIEARTKELGVQRTTSKDVPVSITESMDAEMKH